MVVMAYYVCMHVYTYILITPRMEDPLANYPYSEHLLYTCDTNGI